MMRSASFENDLVVSEMINKSMQTNLNQFAIGVLDQVLSDETKEMHVQIKFDDYSPPRQCMFLAHMIPDLKLSSNIGKKFWISTTGTNVIIGRLHTIAVNEE